MRSPTFNLERKLWSKGYRYIVGLDEVGRGALAGPVVAGAVIFPSPTTNSSAQSFPTRRVEKLEGLRDSKLLSPKQREELAPAIKRVCLSWSIGQSSEKEIMEKGIGPATELAMLRAINNLNVHPDFHLIDYFRLQGIDSQAQEGVVDGDTLVASIAAASVIAKVYRDHLMIDHHTNYPDYNFAAHKGYGTKYHLKALSRYGPCPLHRLNFISSLLLEKSSPSGETWRKKTPEKRIFSASGG